MAGLMALAGALNGSAAAMVLGVEPTLFYGTFHGEGQARKSRSRSLVFLTKTDGWACHRKRGVWWGTPCSSPGWNVDRSSAHLQQLSTGSINHLSGSKQKTTSVVRACPVEGCSA